MIKILENRLPIDEKDDEIRQIKRIDTSKEILLADDSPSVLKTMQNILDKLGVIHKDFVNGQKLLNYVFDERTNVGEIGMVITDLEMPEASGFEVIKQLKGNSKTAHIPIVVNSSMSGSSNEEMARSLNADEFISKSNPAQIEEVMRQHLTK